MSDTVADARCPVPPELRTRKTLTPDIFFLACDLEQSVLAGMEDARATRALFEIVRFSSSGSPLLEHVALRVLRGRCSSVLGLGHKDDELDQVDALNQEDSNIEERATCKKRPRLPTLKQQQNKRLKGWPPGLREHVLKHCSPSTCLRLWLAAKPPNADLTNLIRSSGGLSGFDASDLSVLSEALCQVLDAHECQRIVEALQTVFRGRAELSKDLLGPLLACACRSTTCHEQIDSLLDSLFAKSIDALLVALSHDDHAWFKSLQALILIHDSSNKQKLWWSPGHVFERAAESMFQFDTSVFLDFLVDTESALAIISYMFALCRSVCAHGWQLADGRSEPCQKVFQFLCELEVTLVSRSLPFDCRRLASAVLLICDRKCAQSNKSERAYEE